MPARRSRTENWRESLLQLQERNGALEISVGGPDAEAADDPSVRKNLVWRVRILQIRENEILVEQPVVLRKHIAIDPGVELVGVIAIGPNRWMFKTKNLGLAMFPLNGSHDVPALRLEAPTTVERCQRRNFYRVPTVGLVLPPCECFPLLDPASVVPAQAANRAEILERQNAADAAGHAPAVVARIGPGARPGGDAMLVPEVGPPFPATLVNLGGGGVGLLIEPEHATSINRYKLFWTRIDLGEELGAPLCAVAKLAHLHLDTSKRTYAGMAFDFSADPRHEQFVVSQILRYVAHLQRDQLRRQASAG